MQPEPKYIGSLPMSFASCYLLALIPLNRVDTHSMPFQLVTFSMLRVTGEICLRDQKLRGGEEEWAGAKRETGCGQGNKMKEIKF